MIRWKVVFAFVLTCQAVFPGCDFGEPGNSDPQYVKIHLQSGFRDVVDTFNGTLTKDLVLDGTVSIRFFLTEAEQEQVLTVLTDEGYFTLPDTVHSTPGVMIDPDPSPDFLRVQANSLDKTVVWNYPLEPSDEHGQAVVRIVMAIREIVEARSEYKQLPPARGGYL